jgi:hypothetical protein
MKLNWLLPLTLLFIHSMANATEAPATDTMQKMSTTVALNQTDATPRVAELIAGERATACAHGAICRFEGSIVCNCVQSNGTHGCPVHNYCD